MSEFYDLLHDRSQQFNDIAEQRAFYRQQAATLPERYAEGYDAAAELYNHQNGPAVLFLSLQDGSMRGLFDCLQIPQPTTVEEAYNTLTDMRIGNDARLVYATTEMSPQEILVFANSRQVPCLPAVCLYTKVAQLSL